MTARVVDPGLSFIGLGLAASFFWGASDFLGGLATRKAHVFLVVAVAHSLSLGLLLLIAEATHSPIPPERYALFGLCAGVFGGMALILYYQALSLGAMGLTTAVTGLLTAVVPVVYSFATQGSPKFSQIAGFVLAAAAIGLIAYVPAGKPRPLGLSLAILAGLGFGVFLVVLKVGSSRGLVWQLIFSRMASASLAGAVSLWMVVRPGKDAAVWRKEAKENRFLWIAGAAGAIEATGSLLYMRAAREGRLDVAAVLASLYPVVTILLAAWFLKERTTSSQALGMALALVAVVLVSI
jgi:drug/metabolite transporter (DMT)-like permease